jgi:signal transduction histidine kinase
MTNPDKQTRRLLLIGFGGLILLLAVSGLAALSVLRNIQQQNDRIRDDYFNRDRILEQLRSDIYLSGTYVRDLLLEQDAHLAEAHRQELEAARVRIDENVAAYTRVLRAEEQSPFERFREELKGYFQSLEPALEWNAAQRHEFGYAYMKDSLLPRRMTVVHLADQIATVNQRQMQTRDNEVANLFSRFRRSLLIVLAVSLLCGTLLATGSIRRILGLEQISAKRLEETEHARAALRDLSVRLIEVQESERRALSRELHDEVGQSVSALLLGIGNVAATISPETNASVRAQLNELRRLAEKTVSVVRDMSLLLRPAMLDDLGLIPALQWQAREMSRNSDIYIQVIADSVPDDLPDDHKTCVYRIVQEALRNTVRHAKAKSAQITLNLTADSLHLTIHDDGEGFRPERDKGLGLLGIEERVAHLNGDVHIESRPGEGTSIRVELPRTKAALL